VFFISTSNNIICNYPKDLYDPACVRDGEELYSAVDCRRLPFGGVFNGRRLRCPKIDHAIPCDFCEPQHPLFAKIRAIISNPPPVRSSNIVTLPPAGPVRPGIAQLMDAAEFAGNALSMRQKNVRLGNLCLRWVKRCAACYTFTGLLKRLNHATFRECEKNNLYTQAGWSAGFKAFSRLIQLPKWRACYNCGFPQDCDHDNAKPDAHPQAGTAPCPVPDAYKNMAWVVRYTPHFWDEFVKVFDVAHDASDADYAVWLSQPGEQNRSHYNAGELMVWVDLQHKPM
jgi:hypothetical protein